MKPTINVKLTTGFGNNLFQYSFARLLSEKHSLNLASSGIPEMGIPETYFPVNQNFKTLNISHRGYKTGIYDNCFSEKFSNCNLSITSGYFEDYTLYAPHRRKIIDWFPLFTNYRDDDDLIIHFRLQNRLVQSSHFLNLVDPDFLAFYISSILSPGAKLHIVTDSDVWEPINAAYIAKIHSDVLDGQNAGAPLVPIDYSIKYFNRLVNALKVFSPICHLADGKVISNSGALRANFIDAFNLIRSFNNTLFFNSTFSWWASFLNPNSCAHLLYSWKPSRTNRSPNLGQTALDNWSSFGSSSSLYTVANSITVQNPNTFLNRNIVRAKSFFHRNFSK